MAEVVYQPTALVKLRRLGDMASAAGISDEFVASLREMDERLRSDPEAWGDPVRDYPAARLTLYFHYGPLTIVRYVVHIDGTPVFVLDVRPTPGGSLTHFFG